MVKSRALIQAYSALPVDLVLFDYRGYGLSTGNPTVEGIKTDARTILQKVKSDLISGEQILVVHGQSTGTFLATLSAEEDDAVDAYSLESLVTVVGSWTRSLLAWIARVFVRFEVDDAVAEQNNL